MNNDWLDIELLEDYLDGKLDSKAMHRIEKQALEDPFVAQALAGLSESPKRAAQNVSLLQKQLYERVNQQLDTKKRSVYTWQRLSVAAAAAVMFVSVSIFLFMREEARRTEMAKTRNLPKRVDVNIAPLSPANVDSAASDAYVQATPDKAPVAAGMINPKRKIEDQPVEMVVAADAAPAVKAADSVIASAPQVATVAAAKMNARLAVAAPAVAAPLGGWAALDIYMADHNKLAKEGNSGKFVELSFLVDSEGNPTDIKISKAAGQEFDDEAVRLIKEGPKWEQPKTEGTRVSYTVSF